MQKQVAFWLGLCTEPDVMILDEPVDGLDPVMRRSTMKLVLSEVETRGMTVLISSHNLRELEDVCDYVGIMHQGKIVIEKALDDIKGNIHKIQVAFKNGLPEDLNEKLDVLKCDSFGSVNVVTSNHNRCDTSISTFNNSILNFWTNRVNHTCKTNESHIKFKCF